MSKSVLSESKVCGGCAYLNVLKALASLMSFESEFNKSVQKGWIRKTGSFPEFCVLTDRGKSRERVDFVDIRLTV